MHSNLSSTETIAHHENIRNMPSFTNSFENSMKNVSEEKALKLSFASFLSNVRQNLTFLLGGKSSHLVNKICSGH